MKKIIPLLFTLVISVSACTMQIGPQPAPTASPTPPPQPTLITAPTQIAVTLPPPAASLPLCASAANQVACTEPTAKELDRICTNKLPYTLYALPKGAAVEVITKGFTCHDEGVRGGNQMYSCTGSPQFFFNVKVCSAGCTEGLQPSDQCTPGYGLDSANNCCAPVPTVNGCVEMRWAIGSCGG